tara:strand:- start:10125 stop:11099 length:975 start_codon:yes stop_codon:yes gene_type:complete
MFHYEDEINLHHIIKQYKKNGISFLHNKVSKLIDGYQTEKLNYLLYYFKKYDKDAYFHIETLLRNEVQKINKDGYDYYFFCVPFIFFDMYSPTTKMAILNFEKFGNIVDKQLSKYNTEDYSIYSYKTLIKYEEFGLDVLNIKEVFNEILQDNMSKDCYIKVSTKPEVGLFFLPIIIKAKENYSNIANLMLKLFDDTLNKDSQKEFKRLLNEKGIDLNFCHLNFQSILAGYKNIISEFETILTRNKLREIIKESNLDSEDIKTEIFFNYQQNLIETFFYNKQYPYKPCSIILFPVYSSGEAERKMKSLIRNLEAESIEYTIKKND